MKTKDIKLGELYAVRGTFGRVRPFRPTKENMVEEPFKRGFRDALGKERGGFLGKLYWGIDAPSAPDISDACRASIVHANAFVSTWAEACEKAREDAKSAAAQEKQGEARYKRNKPRMEAVERAMRAKIGTDRLSWAWASMRSNHPYAKPILSLEDLEKLLDITPEG